MKPNILPILPPFFFLLPFLAWGQDPFYINYDTNDGLPSSETYFAHADTNGLIWIATDRGVCTYDGYQFSTYTTKEGLSHNTNFRIFSDRKNRIWVTAWDGSLSVYEDGVFKEIPLHQDTVYGKQRGYAIQLLFDQENNVFVAKSSGSYPKRLGALFRLEANDFTVSRQSVFDFKDIVWRDEERGEILVKMGNKHLYFDGKQRFSVNVALTDTVSSDWLVGFNSTALEHFCNGQLSHICSSIELVVRNFYLDPKRDLWLCTADGLLLYKDANLNMPPRHFFKGLDVTSILMDREGSYWMTSREKGVFWIPSFQFQSLLRPREAFEIQQVLSIGKLSNFLLFGTVNNGIVAVDKQFNLSPQLKEWSVATETKRMYPSENIYYARDFSSIKEINGKLKPANIKEPLPNIQFVKQLKNGLFFNTGVIGYSIFSSNKTGPVFSTYKNKMNTLKNKRKEISQFNVRINCLEEAGDILWIGGLDGLYRLPSEKLLTNIPSKDTSKLMNVRIEDIICMDSQRLWIATIGNGLIFKNGEQHVQLLQEDGLSSNLINKVCLENDSTLWAGTNKGLDKIRFRNEGNSIHVQSISNFSTADGLISNFISDLTIWKEHLWLATNKGINYFYTEKMIENKTPPIIHIEEVLVGGNPINDKVRHQLKHNENNLVFNFLGVSFKKPENKSFYRYRLKHDNNEAIWYYTDNRSIRFLDLAPGHYIFEVAAQNKNGYWSRQTASCSFHINPHFTEQAWFVTLSGLLLVLLIGIGFYCRIKIIQKREEQKRKLQDAELNVLRNQMNPHFIFNSLNSIQSFIFHQDVKQASHYLSKFSRLMRNSLEYSRLEYISIFEEVNFIRSYLDLEKLRFDDRFEVRIEVASDIPVHNYFIPPLLLQPVLENSVKHAFKNISYQGQIDIQFLCVQQGQMIEVIISDNGTGLKENKEKTDDVAHQSMGLSIIESRIKLLNSNGKARKASFKYFNRYNLKQETIGTQAHFMIPIKLE